MPRISRDSNSHWLGPEQPKKILSVVGSASYRSYEASTTSLIEGSSIVASVLIVEDEETDRMILGNIAHGMGHDVHFASDGEEALKVYAGRSIDVVVTDLQMPNFDGLELIVALRALFPEDRCRGDHGLIG